MKPRRIARSALTTALAFAFVVGLGSEAVRADGTPDDGRGVAPSNDEAESQRASALTDRSRALEPTLDFERLVSRTTPADPRFHMGETYIDMSEGKAPASPTRREQEKLALGRTAIEAARQAGTLYAVPNLEEAIPPTAEEIDAMKRQSREARVPAPLPDDPIAGIGDFDPIQETGPAGLTQYEIDKREGRNPEPKRAETSKREAVSVDSGDGSPSTRKEVSDD